MALNLFNDIIRSFYGQPGDPSMNLTVSESHALIQNTPDLQLLDVRSAGEFGACRLKGSFMIPSSTVPKRLEELDPSRPLLAYCSSGGRSAMVLRILEAAGFKKIYHIADGIEGWIVEGFPVEKGSPS